MKKVIVTGGAGFIGSHTVVELTREGYIPVIVDNFSNTDEYIPVIVDNFSNTDERILQGLEQILGAAPIIYKEDCADKTVMRKIFETEKPVAVIHFAAFKAVGESVS